MFRNVLMSEGNIVSCLAGGDPRGEFVIGSDSGSIHLARQLDYETQSLYNLSVSLSDSHRTVTAQVRHPCSNCQSKPLAADRIFNSCTAESVSTYSFASQPHVASSYLLYMVRLG